MKQENEQEKIIKEYENLISFCNSMSALSLANNLHKKKVDFLCEQYSKESEAVTSANAYITMMKKILCKSCDNLCSNYFYNYELYYRSIEDTERSFQPIKESAVVQIDSLMREFLANVLNKAGLEYIWTRVNGDRNEFYTAVHRMFLHFDLNKKLELIVNDINTALELRAAELTDALTWKKVALDENPEIHLYNLEHSDYSQLIKETLQIHGQNGSSGSMMDFGQRFMEEFLPTTKMRQKITELRKAKVIDKIQEDYVNDLKHRKEELITMIDQGIQKVSQMIKQYRITSFFQVNGCNIEQIPEEILRLEQKSTEFKKEDTQCKLIPYLTSDGKFSTIVSSYAVRFQGLVEQDMQKLKEAFLSAYIYPWKDHLDHQIANDIQRCKTQGQEAKQANMRLQEFLDYSYCSFTEIADITSQMDHFNQIEFGPLKVVIDQALLSDLNQMKLKVKEELHEITSKNELEQQDKIRIAIKAMNDIAYQKFFEHWSMSLKANVRAMIERKDFSNIPASINYEVYFNEMQSFLGMDTKELESIKEVLEYEHTGSINFSRYQFLKVSSENNSSNEELIRFVLNQEITSYRLKFPTVQKEMREIYDHALRLYLNEYAETVVRNRINPALDKIQGQFVEEYHAYVREELLRERYHYMDFTKYIHVYGKIEPQILEFILGNEKSFPMNGIAYVHWADGTAVTTQNFNHIMRTTRDRWLGIKTQAEQ